MVGTLGRNTGVRKIVRRSGVHFPFIRLYAAAHGEKYKWESSSGFMYRPLTWKRRRIEGEQRGTDPSIAPGGHSTPAPKASGACPSCVPTRAGRCRLTPCRCPDPWTSSHPATIRFPVSDSHRVGRSAPTELPARPRSSPRPYRSFPLPHQALRGGHVPTCPKSRGFWNIAPKSACPRLSRFPGFLSHRPGSAGRKKCSLDQSCRRSGRPRVTPLPPHADLPFSPSNCCTRVGHHIWPSRVHALKGGSSRDPPL